MDIRIQVPATSANLGPGFDCLGLALELYNTVTVSTDQSFSIALKGTYTAGIPTDESNLVWQTMLRLWQEIGITPPQVALTLETHIPPARGLGSSSAAIIAGLLGANTLSPSPLPLFDLLQLANRIEGHPDNVTPALYGGVTLAVPTTRGVLPRILAQAPALEAVLVIPDLLLKTEAARSVLPPHVTRPQAVFNIAHTGLLVQAFMSGEYSLLNEAMLDKLHQDYRAFLIPGMAAALQAALQAGAYGSALSGSGPTLLALTERGTGNNVAGQMLEVMTNHGVKAQSHILGIDCAGAQITVV